MNEVIRTGLLFCGNCSKTVINGVCGCSKNGLKDPDTIHLLIDGNRGVHIPRKFSENFDLKVWNLEPRTESDPTLAQIAADLSSIGNPQYWDTWEWVLANAHYTDEHGKRWTLHQDDDLFAISEDHQWDAEQLTVITVE